MRSQHSSIAWPVAALLAGMIAYQFGAALAKSLFPLLGAMGVATLRIVLSAAIMTAIARPWRANLGGGSRWALAAYGVSLALMNITFYLAIARIPLGIAVTLEFTGPLGVAILGSRRRLDILWGLVAAAGVVLLTPIGIGTEKLDPVGVALALLAGLFWACYILFGQRAGRLHGGHAPALGMLIASVIALPIGVATTGTALLDPHVLLAATGVAILSSVIPYTFEMSALRRLPAATFGIMMSVEPAIATGIAWLLLGEALAAAQLAAVTLVVTASVGAALTAARRPPVTDAF